MTVLQQRLWLGVLSVLVSFLRIACCSSSSSSYTAVTALDKYGNSVQLQHAREAASRHGRLIVAISVDGNDNSTAAVVVLSLHTPKLGIVATTKQRGVLQRLLLGNDASCYLACTGVKADATWLVAAMRDYCKQLWERYNVEQVSPQRTAQAISQQLLKFMGYDRSLEWRDGVVAEKEEEWARPLGIQTLVVSPSSLTLVEPSGIAQANMRYVAVGKESAAVIRVLRERYDPKASVEEVRELMIGIVREVLEGQQDTELVIELVSRNGVNVSSVPLQDSKDNSKVK